MKINVIVFAIAGLIVATIYAYSHQTATQSPNQQRLFVSNEYFTFGSADLNTVAVKLADVDNDGDLDAVTSNGRHWARQDLILLNNGFGRLLEAIPLGEVWTTSYEPAVSDLNGDGFTDIIATRDRVSSHMFLGDGSGHFIDGGPVGPTGPVRSVQSADLNGDGHPDLVYSSRSAINHIVFGPDFQEIYAFGPSLQTVRVALADLNADGHIDAVFANLGNEGSVIYWGNENGKFGEPYFLAPHSGPSVDVDIGDLNGDGLPDIAFASIGENVIFWNDDTNRFFKYLKFGSGSERSYGIDLGDLNGNGQLDIAIANDGQQNALYLNNGDGFVRFILPEDQNARSYGVTIGDLDGNGFDDLIFANSGSLSRIYLNVTAQEKDSALLR